MTTYQVLQACRSWLTLAFIGVVTGISIQLNWLAQRYTAEEFAARPEFITRTIASAVVFPFVLIFFRSTVLFLVRRLHKADHNFVDRYAKYDVLSFSVLLLTAAGGGGLRFSSPVVMLILIAFLVLQYRAFAKAKFDSGKKLTFDLSVFKNRSKSNWLPPLFFVSGFAALIYQVAWQRALFAGFGVNIESVTIVVALFMLGLGIGSLLGGFLSLLRRERMPLLFLACEIGIGAFGLLSLILIETVSQKFLNESLTKLSTIVFCILIFPTILMGATLPILVTYLQSNKNDFGKLVASLYFVNTLGSASACFLTADLLFPLFGLSGTVFVAAICNFVVGAVVWLMLKSKSALAGESGAASVAGASDSWITQ